MNSHMPDSADAPAFDPSHIRPPAGVPESLRDQFAMAALTALIAGLDRKERSDVLVEITGGMMISRAAYMYADAMIAERAK